MADDDHDEMLRRQFQELQNQKQRRMQLLQKRREEKANRTQETLSNGSSEPSFGVADDLELKV